MSSKQLLTLQDVQVRELDDFQLSPDSRWLMEDMVDLALKIELFEPNDQHELRYFRGVVDMSVHTYSYAPRIPFRVATLWSTWLFYIDDQYDEKKEFGTNIQRVRDLMEDCVEMVKTGKMPEDTPFWRLGQEMYRAMMEIIPSEEVHWRMVEIVAKYFFYGAIEQMKYWRDGKVATRDEFEGRRLYDAAILPCGIMVELCGDCILPTSVFHDPRIDKLRELWGKQIALLNDVYSYDKEVIRVGTDWNLLRILMYHSTEPLSLEQAVDHSIRYINELASRFEELGEDIINDPCLESHRDLLKRYVYCLRQWMVGHIIHSNNTYRYSDPLDQTKKEYTLPSYLQD